METVKLHDLCDGCMRSRQTLSIDERGAGFCSAPLKKPQKHGGGWNTMRVCIFTVDGDGAGDELWINTINLSPAEAVDLAVTMLTTALSVMVEKKPNSTKSKAKKKEEFEDIRLEGLLREGYRTFTPSEAKADGQLFAEITDKKEVLRG